VSCVGDVVRCRVRFCDVVRYCVASCFRNVSFGSVLRSRFVSCDEALGRALLLQKGIVVQAVTVVSEIWQQKYQKLKR